MSKNNAAVSLPASEVRVHLGEVLRRVYVGKEHIIVEKGGLPVVAIIPFSDFEEWQRLQARQRFERLSRAAGLEAQRQGLTEEQFKEVRTSQDATRPEATAEGPGTQSAET